MFLRERISDCIGSISGMQVNERMVRIQLYWCDLPRDDLEFILFTRFDRVSEFWCAEFLLITLVSVHLDEPGHLFELFEEKNSVLFA